MGEGVSRREREEGLVAEAGLGFFLFVERKSIHVQKKNFDIKLSFLEGTRGQFLLLFFSSLPYIITL